MTARQLTLVNVQQLGKVGLIFERAYHWPFFDILQRHLLLSTYLGTKTFCEPTMSEVCTPWLCGRSTCNSCCAYTCAVDLSRQVFKDLLSLPVWYGYYKYECQRQSQTLFICVPNFEKIRVKQKYI